MQGHDIIVIGASVGGVEALSNLVAQFPEDLPATIFVVQHVTPTATGHLAHILNRAGPLPATIAQDCESFEPEHIYVAPPDHHLLVKQGCLRVTRGLRENRVRPAIDPLFRSAAVAYGARVGRRGVNWPAKRRHIWAPGDQALWRHCYSARPH